MHFTNQFDKLTKDVQDFLKKKVDDGVTFGNPCYKYKKGYFCHCDFDGEDAVVILEEMETQILCGIADDIVEMNKNLGGQN